MKKTEFWNKAKNLTSQGQPPWKQKGPLLIEAKWRIYASET